MSKWTDLEDSILIENYNKGLTYKQIKELLPNRTINSIQSRKRKIIPTNRDISKIWTKENLKILYDYHLDLSVNELSEKIGCCFSTTIKKLKELDLYEANWGWRKWTEEEDDYVRENYLTETSYSIGRKLKRTSNSVKQRASLLGLKKPVAGKWSDEEVTYLKDNYSSKSMKQIQKKIKRTNASIYNKAYELGLDELNKTEKEKEIAFVIANSETKTDEEIAYKLNCSIDKIADIRKNNNLYKKPGEQNKESFIEKSIRKLLDKYEIEYKKQYQIGDYIVDFYIERINTVIEVQGDYWHCNPKVYEQGPKDLKQTTFILKDYNKKCFLLYNNYNLLYLWEHDILNNKEYILNQIKKLKKHYSAVLKGNL